MNLMQVNLGESVPPSKKNEQKKHNSLLKTPPRPILFIQFLIAKLIYNLKCPYVCMSEMFCGKRDVFGSCKNQKAETFVTFQSLRSIINYKSSMTVGLLSGSYLAIFIFHIFPISLAFIVQFSIFLKRYFIITKLNFLLFYCLLAGFWLF